VDSGFAVCSWQSLYTLIFLSQLGLNPIWKTRQVPS
jgi:hypothetical protein